LFSREGDTGVLHGVSEAFALFVVVGVELDGWCGFCGEAVDCLYLCSRPDSMLGSCDCGTIGQGVHGKEIRVFSVSNLKPLRYLLLYIYKRRCKMILLQKRHPFLMVLRPSASSSSLPQVQNSIGWIVMSVGDQNDESSPVKPKPISNYFINIANKTINITNILIKNLNPREASLRVHQ
jgi:hypothetical protein